MARVLLFGPLRDLAGWREREIDAPDLAALRALIANDDPALGEALAGKGVQVALDQAIVRADFEHPGEEDVARRVEADLSGRPEASEVRPRMAELLAKARREVAEDVVGHN